MIKTKDFNEKYRKSDELMELTSNLLLARLAHHQKDASKKVEANYKNAQDAFSKFAAKQIKTANPSEFEIYLMATAFEEIGTFALASRYSGTHL